MKNQFLKNPVFFCTLFGLIASLGAPLGFYVHDYLFNNFSNHSFQDHISWIHKNSLPTIFYIGLGTNLFFSLFGFLTGKFLEQIISSNLNSARLKDEKIKLFAHLLLKIRASTSLGIESLLLLKARPLSAPERNEILQHSIQELNKSDAIIRRLVDIYSSHHCEYNLLDESNLKKIVFDQTSKYNIKFDSDKIYTTDTDLLLTSNYSTVEIAISEIFDWIVSNEVSIEKVIISYLYKQSAGTELFIFQPELLPNSSNSYTCIEFKIVGNCLDFSAPLAVELVENLMGQCYFATNSIFILLPCTKQKLFTDTKINSKAS